MAERTEIVTLTVDGQRHNGWTSVRVTLAIDSLCGSFELGLAERWAEQPERFVLEAGARCTVAIDGATVITGYIDTLAPSIEGDSHAITIAGRDRAGDLVDCAAVAKPGSWRDTRIETIAAELAKPFGITVIARAPTGPALRRFALQQGETVQAAIERLCRFAGLLAVSNAAGEIELMVPATGAPVASLTYGVNILTGAATYDVTGRFSEYVVKGQAAGDDHANGATVASPSASATDPAIKRYRPMLIVAEEQATLANLLARARWEASTRAGRGQPVTVTVPGWRDDSGALWRPNTIATVDAAPLFANGPMLIQTVTFDQDDRGTTATLTVVPPEAWSQMAIPEAAEPSRIGKKKALPKKKATAS